MGGYDPQYWRLELWEHEGFSPVKEYLEHIAQTEPKNHRLIKRKIRSLLARPLAQVEKSGLLRKQQDGLWEFEVLAGGSAHFLLGPLRQVSWGTTFVALEGFRGDNEAVRLMAVSITQGRLAIYQENESVQHNLYGFQ